MPKYIDISMPIEEGMPVYSTDPKLKIRQFKSLRSGDSCNLIELSLGSHTGTHIDAPAHVIEKAAGIDSLKPEGLLCDVLVTSINNFSKAGLKSIRPKKIKGVLFKNSRVKAILNKKQAGAFLNMGLKVIGTENDSIEGSIDKKHPVHRMLLGKGVVIIENLDLKKARQGLYRLICLPLKIKGADGAPCRALLEYD